MQTIAWTDALRLDDGPMDRIHREFVDLLALAQTAADDAVVSAWSAMLDHTVLHFGREDDWMRLSRFSAADSHMLQHRVVLNLMREGLAKARGGNLQPVRALTHELATWFSKHNQVHDAALALHLRRAAAARRTPRRHTERALARQTPHTANANTPASISGKR